MEVLDYRGPTSNEELFLVLGHRMFFQEVMIPLKDCKVVGISG